MIHSDPVTAWTGPFLTIGKIREIVCNRFDLHPSQISSPDRHKMIALARHLVVYFARETTDMSFPEIGRSISRDHATVMSSYTLIRAAIGGTGPACLKIQKHVEDLTSILERQ